MPLVENVCALVGHTPVVRLSKLSDALPGNVVAKLENTNPSGSVKDRAALSMVRAAERDGALGPGGTIVEATSGNTGIALAQIGAVCGYRVVIVMPETMSVERRRLIRAYGAEVELTPGPDGMNGSLSRAQEIVESTSGGVMMRQFENAANPLTHEATTAVEIWEDLKGQVDVFVAGVGTGGTLSGVARGLRARTELRVVAVEPVDSAVLSGGEPGPHRIQGIGAGFVPANLDRSMIDEVITVSAEDATTMSRRIAREEGIFCGVSAGANVWAALEVASREESRGRQIVTVICDTGERYLSTWLFQDDKLDR